LADGSHERPACCAPALPSGGAATATFGFDIPQRSPREIAKGMAAIPGGAFRMGGADPDAFPQDGEGPVRTVRLSPFLIDRYAVANRQFAAFVKDTGYATDAERFGWSFVFHAHLGPGTPVMDAAVPEAPWWVAVPGAYWKAPEGPGSSIERRPNHPVVHVSWNDASAYAAWVGKRLPTEAEWEMAARGGLDQARFPWGDELTPRGRHRCNIWQGEFPAYDTGEDGFTGTAPVNAFAPNGHGLHNVAGNVWEWCADWWSTAWHSAESPETRNDPRGPSTGTARVIRGGSFLCHESYCNRYRVAARTCNTPDSTTAHTGFRCAADPA
jgi:formylglycine-generating enzyme